MKIPAVGPITALTWAREVGKGRALCIDQKSYQLLRVVRCRERFRGYHPAHTTLEATQPASGTIVIEAAKMAPRNSPALAMTGRNRKAMRIEPRWPWPGGQWPICRRRSPPKRFASQHGRTI